MCQELGMEPGNTAIPKIATAFAGGIGNSGAVCGAVSGAVMAIGLTRERSEDRQEIFGTLALAGEFRRRFEAERGNIGCRELTGLDLSTDEGVQQLMNSDIPRTVCFPAVAAAYRLVLELLAESA